MQLCQSHPVQFLVVNHSNQPMTLQVQFRVAQMQGLVVCGASFVSAGVVPANGGSTVVTFRFMPLVAGLLRVQGCWVVDLVSEREIAQPALFDTFVDELANQ
jgi:hypothetical protein